MKNFKELQKIDKKKLNIKCYQPYTERPNNILNRPIYRYLLFSFNAKRRKPVWPKKNYQQRFHKLNTYLWKYQKNQFQKDQRSIWKLYKFLFLFWKLLQKSNRVHYTFSKLELEYQLKLLFWQTKYFIHFLHLHPDLLDHLIKSLTILSSLNNIDHQEKSKIFLTNFWITFFDYIHLFQQRLYKWKGIRIRLSGRLGYRKMGRAKRYLQYSGKMSSSSTVDPFDYSYSQLKTRYGVIGMRIAIH